jgi:hypothetical protein
MSRYPLCGLAALGLLLTTFPAAAEAKAGDAAWAKCVWAQVPVSADKWLSMPLPSWNSSFSDRNLLLGHLLIATCDESGVNPKKPNRSPNWKALAAALKASRPATVPTAQPAPQVDVALCRSTATEDGPPYLYLAEIVRRVGGKDKPSFQQYFASHQGKPVMLPQDIRTVPASSARIDRSCRSIGPEGEVAGAQ